MTNNGIVYACARLLANGSSSLTTVRVHCFGLVTSYAKDVYSQETALYINQALKYNTINVYTEKQMAQRLTKQNIIGIEV